MNKTRCINCMRIIDENIASCPHCGYGQTEEQSPFSIKPNTILRGRYLAGRVLGQGGFGITYVGYDLTLDIKVAIKEYFPMGLAVRNSTVSNQLQWNTTQFNSDQWEQGCDSFLKEARRMAKIDSLPGIVRVRDTFPENKTAYIVMDYIEGENLKQRLMKTGTMSLSKCIELLEPLMESLGKMHQKGLIHRDISPDNIMVQPDGSACLLDFGAAKDVSFQQSIASQQVAKKGFSPPEQYREKGKIGSWTDIYALCATIYYCITGRMVPDAMDRMYKDTLDFDVPVQEPLGEAAISALKDGLQLNSESRIQTVEELLQRLKESGQPITCKKSKLSEAPEPSKLSKSPKPPKPSKPPKLSETSEQSKPSESPKPSRKKKIVVLSAAAVCVFLLVTVGIRYWDKEQDTDLTAPTASVINSEENTETYVNTLMEDSSCDWLSNDSSQLQGTVLGSELSRDSIISVTFTDTLAAMPETAWDVSWNQDGTVMAWKEQNTDSSEYYKLYIGADGGVKGKNCYRLFAGYYNVETIDFNDSFDTSEAANMEWMFYGCKNLTALNVSSFDTGQVTDMEGFFYSCENLTELDVSNFDTGNVTNMSYMFAGCENLTKLDLSSFETGKVTNMEGVFAACENLTKLDLSSFDTSQVTNMRLMFECCENLAELNVSTFDTGNVTEMRWMFNGCRNLTALDVSNFDTGNVTNMGYMFFGCESLTELDVSNFDTSKVVYMDDMFTDCGITAEEAGLKE